jgi:hypothetical protein
MPGGSGLGVVRRAPRPWHASAGGASGHGCVSNKHLGCAAAPLPCQRLRRVGRAAPRDSCGRRDGRCVFGPQGSVSGWERGCIWMHSKVWARTAGRVKRRSATAGKTCSGRGARTCELLRDGEIPARQRAFAHSGGHSEGLLELLGLCGGGRGVTWQVHLAARFGRGSTAPARRDLPVRSQRAHRAQPRAWREHGARWGVRLRHRRTERELHTRAARARLGDLRHIHFEPAPGARLGIRCSAAWAASHTQGGRRRRARGCRRRGAGTAHMAGCTCGAGARAGRGARACARACPFRPPRRAGPSPEPPARAAQRCGRVRRS